MKRKWLDELRHSFIIPVYQLIIRERKRIVNKWPFLFITFIGPLLGFFLVAWIFIEGVPRKLPVGIVDNDNTFLSRQIVRYVNATPIASVKFHCTSLIEAKKLLEEGKIDAILVIPLFAERNVLRGQQANLALYLNNQNVLKGGLLNSGIQKSISTLSAYIKVRAKLQKGKTQQQALSEIMPVQVRSIILFNPYINYSYYLSAAIIPAILCVFVILGSMYAIGYELLVGSAKRWLNAANQQIGVALFGKLLPYTIIYFCMAMIMNIILFWYLGMPLKGSFGIILIAELITIIAYQFFSIFMLSLTSNVRLALSIGSAYSMLALTFSGLTFPTFGMPSIAHAFSYLFPFTYWLKIFVSQSIEGLQVEIILPYLFANLSFVILGLMLVPRLRFLIANPDNWKKL